MTLAEIIQRYEQRQAERRTAAPVDYVPAAVAMTPRGDVAVAVCRLRRQLVALDAEDLAAAAEEIRAMLAELQPAAAIA